jgi:hypothetical protein
MPQHTICCLGNNGKTSAAALAASVNVLPLRPDASLRVQSAVPSKLPAARHGIEKTAVTDSSVIEPVAAA